MPAQLEGYARALSSVSGCIQGAKGLRRSAFGSHPVVVVKGIKGNLTLVELFRTDAAVSVAAGGVCNWDQSWAFDLLKIRTRDQFVGLKFSVFDGEEFLGGADYDISEMPNLVTRFVELELSGIVLAFHARDSRKKLPPKARLLILVEVQRQMMPLFEFPEKMLLDSFAFITRVSSICCHVVRARGLAGDSLPMCFVRCFMMSGKIVTLHNTKCHRNAVSPNWSETFVFDFPDKEDKPLVIMFDVLGGTQNDLEEAAAIWNTGNHLGGGMMAVAAIQDESAFVDCHSRFKIPLICDVGMYERRLARDGKPIDATAWKQQRSNSGVSPTKTRSLLPSGKSLRQSLLHLSGGHKTHGSKSDADANTCLQSITIEAFVERDREVPMPNVKLLEEPEEVEEPENNPDEQVQALYRAGARRFIVAAEDRIMAIYGTVHGAADLISADLSSKTNPYVVAEALSRSGKHIFLYRTRPVQNTLHPEWNESFMFITPPSADNPYVPMDLVKILFSVYDAHHSMLEMGDHEDMLLGRCGVDITFLRNCDCSAQEVPLSSVPARHGGEPSKGNYRRNSTVSVEVRVERRINKVVSEQNSSLFIDVNRHNESRPQMKEIMPAYHDLSQDVTVTHPPEYDVGARVLALRDADVLLERAHSHKEHQQLDHGWLAARKTMSRSLPQLPVASNPRKMLEQPVQPVRSASEGSLVPCRRPWLPSITESHTDALQRFRDDDHNLDGAGLSPLAPRRIRQESLQGFTTRFGDPRYDQLSTDPFAPGGSKEKAFIPEFTNSPVADSVHKSLFRKPPSLFRKTQVAAGAWARVSTPAGAGPTMRWGGSLVPAPSIVYGSLGWNAG